jgi:hypothetical protein
MNKNNVKFQMSCEIVLETHQEVAAIFTWLGQHSHLKLSKVKVEQETKMERGVSVVTAFRLSIEFGDMESFSFFRLAHG